MRSDERRRDETISHPEMVGIIQGGPAKVRPTYIFAGNIISVTFECMVLANVITV